MSFLCKVFFILFLSTTTLFADEASDWLKQQIDTILDAYKNTSISKVDRFNLIEDSINNNFAGAGISKFVAGNSWSSASKEDKKEYLEGLLDRIEVRLDNKTNDHTLKVFFRMGLVGDGIEYVNPSSKKDGYKVIEVRSDRSVLISREKSRDRAKRSTSSLTELQSRQVKKTT